jgi:hypothetical protein
MQPNTSKSPSGVLLVSHNQGWETDILYVEGACLVFCEMKTMSRTVLGVSAQRLMVTMLPPVENARSEVTEVAVHERYLRAR